MIAFLQMVASSGIPPYLDILSRRLIFQPGLGDLIRCPRDLFLKRDLLRSLVLALLTYSDHSKILDVFSEFLVLSKKFLLPCQIRSQHHNNRSVRKLPLPEPFFPLQNSSHPKTSSDFENFRLLVRAVPNSSQMVLCRGEKIPQNTFVHILGLGIKSEQRRAFPYSAPWVLKANVG